MNDDRMYTIDVQGIDMSGLRLDGRILDIGGGGEGIVGQVLGEKVISIDSRSDELKEAADGPLKIMMDACDLKFLDNTFDAATSFFTLMYIEKHYHQKVFAEIYRVLKEEGTFIIWDVVISKYQNGDKDIFVVPLDIKLKDKNVTTAYGVMWNQAEQDMNYYIKLGREAGFEVIESKDNNRVYTIKFKKSDKSQRG